MEERCLFPHACGEILDLLLLKRNNRLQVLRVGFPLGLACFQACNSMAHLTGLDGARIRHHGAEFSGVIDVDSLVGKSDGLAVYSGDVSSRLGVAFADTNGSGVVAGIIGNTGVGNVADIDVVIARGEMVAGVRANGNVVESGSVTVESLIAGGQVSISACVAE